MTTATARRLPTGYKEIGDVTRLACEPGPKKKRAKDGTQGKKEAE